MMQSVFLGSDAELVSRILYLHRSGPRVLDTTFGHGRFWGRDELVPPGQENYTVVGLDLRMKELAPGLELSRYPQLSGVMAADFTWLPFRKDTFNAIICDPPFLSRGGDRSVMKQRYSATGTYQDLLDSLQRGLPEFLRVLKPGGVVILKMMDMTEGRRRRWAHIDIANLWIPRGLRLDDMIVKVAPQSMDSPNWRSQERSRSSHTYFMVFRPSRKTPETPETPETPAESWQPIRGWKPKEGGVLRDKPTACGFGAPETNGQQPLFLPQTQGMF